jgi:hypothetical protein
VIEKDAWPAPPSSPGNASTASPRSIRIWVEAEVYENDRHSSRSGA